ncbi:hypothetical protein Hanom_Chr07g00626741 [Helianthus anomalus]
MRHPPFDFSTITGFATQLWYLTSRKIPALSSSHTCSFIAFVLSAPRLRLLWIFGSTDGYVFKQCSIMLRGTPVMSAGVQANISMFRNNSCFRRVLMFDEMAWPIVTVCSGYLRFKTHFSGSVVETFAAFVGRSSSVDITSFLAYMIATPVLVGKPIAEWGVEVTIFSSPCVSLPISISCLDFTGITMKFTFVVLECFPSENVTGKLIWPRGKIISLQNPDKG